MIYCKLKCTKDARKWMVKMDFEQNDFKVEKTVLHKLNKTKIFVEMKSNAAAV